MTYHIIGNTTIPGFYRFDEAMDTFAGVMFVSASGTVLVADNLDGTYTRITGFGLTHSGALSSLTLTGGTIIRFERTDTSATTGGTIFETIENLTIDATTFQSLMTTGLNINYLFPNLFASSDYLLGGTLNDTLYGFDNIDVIIGGGGNDYIYGGDARDDMEAGAGADTIDGGNGFDFMWYFGGAVTVNLATSSGTGNDAQGDSYVSIEGVYGSDNGDYIIGNNDANYLYGYEGNDIIVGGINDDTIYGAGGRDDLDGGSGNDYLNGGSGFDYAWYEGSATTVNLYLGRGTGEATGDTLTGIEGIIGSASNDYLYGDDNANHFYGGEGSNTLQGNGGNDTLVGGSSRDDIAGGNGSDALNGGGGFDYAWYYGVGVTVDLLAGTGASGEAAGDELTGIEGVISYTGDDSLKGDANDNQLAANGGADSVAGGNGADTISGDAGNDQLNGGEGADWIYGGSEIDTLYYDNNGAVTVNLTTGAGTGGDAANDRIFEIENVIGTTANDFLIGNLGNNSLEGGTGFDILLGSDGADTLSGGANRDDLHGGVGADSLVGGDGYDYVWYTGSAVYVDLNVGTGSGGEAQGDTFATIEGVIGTENEDTIEGNSSANILYGGDGGDLLLGNGGGDTYYGQSGNDIFGFNLPTDGNVLIADFVGGQDVIAAASTGFGSGLTTGSLASNRLVLGTSANEAFGQFLFNTSTSNLFWDADGTGSGAAVQLATLTGITTLAATDFYIE